jgi:hypothetical protein
MMPGHIVFVAAAADDDDDPSRNAVPSSSSSLLARLCLLFADHGAAVPPLRRHRVPWIRLGALAAGRVPVSAPHHHRCPRLLVLLLRFCRRRRRRRRRRHPRWWWRRRRRRKWRRPGRGVPIRGVGRGQVARAGVACAMAQPLRAAVDDRDLNVGTLQPAKPTPEEGGQPGNGK